jgi:hypothetical protein
MMDADAGEHGGCGSGQLSVRRLLHHRDPTSVGRQERRGERPRSVDFGNSSRKGAAFGAIWPCSTSSIGEDTPKGWSLAWPGFPQTIGMVAAGKFTGLRMKD